MKIFFAVMALLTVSACGKDTSTPFDKDPTAPITDGGEFDQPGKRIAPSPRPSPTASPSTSPAATPSPSPSSVVIRPTKYCAPHADGTFHEDFQVIHGRSDAKDYRFGEGGGCIMRPILEVWAVSLNAELMAWNGTDKSHWLDSTPPTGVAKFFDAFYTVGSVIGDVNWEMFWYHTVKEGTNSTPERILINYKKIAGTHHIGYWEGTIFLTDVSPGVTGFAMRNQINAAQTSEEDAAGTVSDVFGKLRTGQPNFSGLPK